MVDIFLYIFKLIFWKKNVLYVDSIFTLVGFCVLNWLYASIVDQSYPVLAKIHDVLWRHETFISCYAIIPH